MRKALTRMGSAFLVMLFAAALTVLPSFAWSGEGEYYSIDVNVTLLDNGDAQVIELWDVEIDDDWSELFIPKTNLGQMSIRNMQVKDLTNEVEYTYTGED